MQLVSEFANSALLHTFTSVYNDYPLLHEAAATGNVDMYSLLVETGANEKVRDKENRTIMHVVAEHNCEKLGLRLVDEEKAELVTQDNNGWTPLHQAVFSKSVAVSELLLQKGEIVCVLYIYICAPQYPLSIVHVLYLFDCVCAIHLNVHYMQNCAV